MCLCESVSVFQCSWMNIYSTLVKVSDAYKVTLGNDYFIIKKKKFTAIDNSRK